ncbi:CoA ester lyase [Aestuariicella hydrocarbonica]|uniref:CoA ester lyase n=1 Tax=Pseudomaricurvus hydrocarbonicus TaxID=1470433 RepID=A0A9E5MQ60_9GAMM|nr:CoA ester lyase [Aestuariicella hydrocarbonica]NHO68320.1 CoA ester lyase [Aestuariicella hydrocarbonica]
MTVFQKTRSVLFVPASRPERFGKALASGADVVVIDLEDAVAAAEKDAARESLRAYLEANPDLAVLVRINASGTQEFVQDLELCRQQRGVAAIMVAKAQSVEALQLAAATGKPIWPLLETALGITELANMAKVKGVERFCFGALDMGVDLGLKPDTAGAQLMLDRVRVDLVLYSTVAGLQAPIETVYPSIDDEATVERIARQASEMGFSGMLCIHPQQLVPIHRGFSPDVTDLDWARRVLAAAESGEGVFKFDGKMVDAPVIQRARLIVSQAGDEY